MESPDLLDASLNIEIFSASDTSNTLRVLNSFTLWQHDSSGQESFNERADLPTDES